MPHLPAVSEAGGPSSAWGKKRGPGQEGWGPHEVCTVLQGRPQRSGRQAFTPPGQSWEAWTMPHSVLPVHGEVSGTVGNGGRGEPKNARGCGRLFHPRLQCCCNQALGILRGAAPGSRAPQSPGNRLHCSALGPGWAGDRASTCWPGTGWARLLSWALGKKWARPSCRRVPLLEILYG